MPNKTSKRHVPTDNVKTHNGKSLNRERAPSISGQARKDRAAEREAEGAVAMAEHKEREIAMRANMERLRAERLARGAP